MKVEFAPREGMTNLYPWRSMNAIGDYFDVPRTEAKNAYRGAINAAYRQKLKTGYNYHAFKLGNGSLRVMLVDIEPGAVRT